MEHHHSTIDGIDIAWWRTNPGSASSRFPVVFLHGLGASSRDLVYLAHHAALRDRALVFLDFPGFGDSARPGAWSYTMEAQADLIAALLREMIDTPAALVGHSMGGSIAIAMATRHPDLVARLVVAEPNLDPGTGTLSRHIAQQPEAGFVSRGYRALVYQTRRQTERGDAVAASFLPSLERASPVALHRSAVSLLAARVPTFRQQIASLAIPRAAISGATSPPDDPPLAEPAIARYTVDNAGHVMMAENPGGFAEAVCHALDCRLPD